MLELILGQIPEAIFFSLFMIYAKGIKEKRILFTVLMVAEYLLLKYSFQYNWLFQIGFMIMTFLTLKILYKEKSQVTDLFILLIGYIYMMIVSAICFIPIQHNITFENYIISCIINRIILFTSLFVLNHKLEKLQKLYKKFWNRNNQENKKIKSTTFRSLNIFVFNIIYFIINAGMIYAIFLLEKG